MKTILTVLSVLSFQFAFAQWNTSPTNSANIYFSTSNTGNVGIGTNAPGAKLHIANSGGGQGLWIAGSNSSKYLSLWQGNSGAVIEPIGTDDFYVGYTGWTDVFLASAGGKVAVGLTNPDYLFQVNSTNFPTIAIGKSNANTNGKSTLAFFAGDGTAANGFFVNYLKNTSVDRLAIVDGGNVECMSILNGGNIGIGTTAPGSYKLAVEGKIGAREVNVTNTTPWPDYVLNDDYQLAPLETVQRYIKQHHHLPEVPSEKEVATNGQDLGEMNAILLKKIEELTLYLLEQQKEIDELKKAVKK